MKGPRSKVEAILTVLFVVTQGLLHGRHQMDRAHFRERSFDATVLRKVRKHLDPPHQMPAPALARCIQLLITDAELLEKAPRQIAGTLISQLVPVRKLYEMLPNGPVSIP